MRALGPWQRFDSERFCFFQFSAKVVLCVRAPSGQPLLSAYGMRTSKRHGTIALWTIALLSLSSHQPRKAGRHAVSPQPRTLRMPFFAEYLLVLAGHAFMLVQSLQQKYVPSRAP